MLRYYQASYSYNELAWHDDVARSHTNFCSDRHLHYFGRVKGCFVRRSVILLYCGHHTQLSGAIMCVEYVMNKLKSKRIQKQLFHRIALLVYRNDIEVGAETCYRCHSASFDMYLYPIQVAMGKV